MSGATPMPSRLPAKVRLRYRVRARDRAAAEADVPLMVDKLHEYGAIQVVTEALPDCPCGDPRPEHPIGWCAEGERIFEQGHR